MQLDEFIECNKGKLRTLAMFALVFVTGFASGYYYLDDSHTDQVLTIKEGSDNCTSLFKQETDNVANSVSDGQVAGKNAADAPAAGNVLSAAAAQPVPSSDAAIKAFASSKNSTLYHTRDCPYVKRIKPENVVWFNFRQEAEAAGRKPHSCVK